MNKQRFHELNEDETHVTKDFEKSDSINEEKTLIQSNNTKLAILLNYLKNSWNLYDWASIIILLVCIGTHIDDIVNHNEYKARLHIRIMSFSIVFISIRLLKTSRILVIKFGTLVVILYYVLSEMIYWFCLFMVIWLSFSKTSPSWQIGVFGYNTIFTLLSLFNLDRIRWNKISNVRE